MLTTVLAYFLIACYFVIERLLRKGEQALTLEATPSDGGSSRWMLASGFFNIIIVLLAPILNSQRLGYWGNKYIGWIGVFLMIAGLILRYWSAKTLGEFYTRTLRIVKGQQIVEQGPYSLIRHPGYLAISLMIMGAGLAVTNWIILLVITLTDFLSKAYRIRVEENMLEAAFGEKYQAYSQKTWKLIPFVY